MSPIRLRRSHFLAAGLLLALHPGLAWAGPEGDPPACHGSQEASSPQAEASGTQAAPAQESRPEPDAHAAHSAPPDEHAAHRARLADARVDATPEVVAADGLRIPDLELLDQDGNSVHFYRDLVEGRRVAINFVFTTCTTICPPMGANFAKLQELLAGQDVSLISVSVDPMTDTPDRLKAWAARFGARPGWTLVTGDKGRIDNLLKALKVFTPDAEDHSPIVLVGDDASGRWRRAYGLAPAHQLEALIAELASGEQNVDSRVGAPKAATRGGER